MFGGWGNGFGVEVLLSAGMNPTCSTTELFPSATVPVNGWPMVTMEPRFKVAAPEQIVAILNRFPSYGWKWSERAEAHVDFGQGAWLTEEDGKRKRPHFFRIVLSHLRKGYSEAVWRQTTESFTRCVENAFRYFGGVPKTQTTCVPP